MKIAATQELLDICRHVLEEQKTIDEWAEIESDDMFQSEHFCGGFDATERAFCFSLYDDDNGREYWFQLTLDDVRMLAERTDGEIDIRPAKY